MMLGMGVIPVPIQTIEKDGNSCNAPDHQMVACARGIEVGMSLHMRLYEQAALDVNRIS
jgi:hypothetical protein